MSAKAATTSVTTMRTAQILLGLTIAPAKKDLLGMDTHAQVKKKLSTRFLFPQRFTECDHIYGIFHLVETISFTFLCFKAPQDFKTSEKSKKLKRLCTPDHHRF